MTELNQKQMKDVNGGLLFAAIPMWFAVATITTELAIIASIASRG